MAISCWGKLDFIRNLIPVSLDKYNTETKIKPLELQQQFYTFAMDSYVAKSNVRVSKISADLSTLSLDLGSPWVFITNYYDCYQGATLN